MGVLDRFRLDGKRAFVTGGSRGLGREMALGLAEAGADLILVGREQAALDQTAAEVARAGPRRPSRSRRTSGSRPRPSARAGRRSSEHGPVDILINNVGGRRVDIPTQDMPVETWQHAHRPQPHQHLRLHEDARRGDDRAGAGAAGSSTSRRSPA